MAKIPKTIQFPIHPTLGKMLQTICEKGGYRKPREAIEESIRRYYQFLLDDTEIVEPETKLEIPKEMSVTTPPPAPKPKPKPPIVPAETLGAYMEQVGGGQIVEKNNQLYRRYNDGALEKDEILPERFQKK